MPYDIIVIGAGLSGLIGGLRLASRQHQLVSHHRHQIRPALHLLGCTQARLVPQQILLVEAIAMLLPETSPIQARQLLCRRALLAQPPEPGYARVALAAVSRARFRAAATIAAGCDTACEQWIRHLFSILTDLLGAATNRPQGLG